MAKPKANACEAILVLPWAQGRTMYASILCNCWATLGVSRSGLLSQAEQFTDRGRTSESWPGVKTHIFVSVLFSCRLQKCYVSLLVELAWAL